MTAAVEVARAVTGTDPYDKYPKENGKAHLVGKSLSHCGKVMWEYLGRPGSFKIIRDADAGEWRVYKPWLDGDRKKDARRCPPLIPRRFIQEISWENKKEGIPKLVRLKNGWEIHFYSSEGDPPQGTQASLVWFDEEVVGDQWYPEMVARLLDREGRLLWSATPQAATEQMYALHVRASEESVLPEAERKCREFVFLLEDNPYISDGQKRDLASRLTDEERRVRIAGEFALTGFRVYPEFGLDVHGVDYFDVPRDWCRYAAVDPGRQVCAVLFAAVPPPGQGDFVVLYDELYVKHCTAETFGARMAEKCTGQNFEAFLIDHQAGRVGEIGSGLTIEEQYSSALKANRVKSNRTGHGFLWGATDTEAGVSAFRGWLRVREDGTPRLRVMREKLPAFCHEIKYYHYQRRGAELLDKPVKKNDHQMDNCRYLAMLNPQYVKPKKHLNLSSAVLAVKAKRDRRAAKSRAAGGDFVRLGPGRN